MALAALTIVWCLAGPPGNDRPGQAASVAEVVSPYSHYFDVGPTVELPGPSAAGRQEAGLCAAMLGDIDDHETEDDNPSPASPGDSHRDDGLVWNRASTRPGAGHVRHVSTERILLRC